MLVRLLGPIAEILRWRPRTPGCLGEEPVIWQRRQGEDCHLGHERHRARSARRTNFPPARGLRAWQGSEATEGRAGGGRRDRPPSFHPTR